MRDRSDGKESESMMYFEYTAVFDIVWKPSNSDVSFIREVLHFGK